MTENETPLILAVDDDPTNLLLLTKILTKSGYRAGQAGSGAECLEYVSRTVPDLILLDVRMPEMDGFEVCRRLQDNDATAGIPVMFLTAEGRSDENVSKGFGVGAIDYITKPFSRVDVLARIQLVLKQRAVQESYRQLANKDPLTGLDNRRRLHERLAEIMSDSQRHGRPVTAVMIDLDHFKRVNDTYGHDFGDDVLVAFGRLLQTQCRLEDEICRFGGEEFVLLLPDTSLDSGERVVERLRQIWEQTVFEAPEGDEIRLTASFGLAGSLPGEGFVHGDDLIKRADQAVYAAKDAGRNRSARFDQICADSPAPQTTQVAGVSGNGQARPLM